MKKTHRFLLATATDRTSIWYARFYCHVLLLHITTVIGIEAANLQVRFDRYLPVVRAMEAEIIYR